MALGHWLKDYLKDYIGPHDNSGGGGSSDFSTAEVTVKHSGNLMSDAYFPSAIVIERNTIVQRVLEPSRKGDRVYSIVLYKGKGDLGLQPSNEYNPIVGMSGAIVADTEEDIYIITGDCTITMNGQQSV